MPFQTKRYLIELLFRCKILPENHEILKESWNFIKNGALKPNDALILATCKHYRIKHLISLDRDFYDPCKNEGINLITSLEDLKKVFKGGE